MILKLCSFFFLFSHLSLANDSIEKLIKKSPVPSASLGVWIQGEDRRFGHNEKKLFTPASLSKIPTAGAVLDILGLQHRYTTEVLMVGKLENGNLNGDLYLKGGGDPGLVSENYWSMINQLKRTGLKSIKGTIFVDDFLFDDVRFSESRQSRRVDRAYDAPIGAMSFNWNSVNVFVRPGFKLGDRAQVFLDPENEYVTLVNKTTTGKRTDIQVNRQSLSSKDQFTVTGTVSLTDGEKAVYKSITQPELWAGYNFKAFLKRDGIDCECTVARQKTPSSAQLLVSLESKPLRDMVADLAKFSNNYVAEMLTKSLSTSKPANMKSGVERIRHWVEAAGVKPNSYTFLSPSGFSHDNKFTPEDLGILLNKINTNFRIAAEFKTALPISGVDGTLKTRLRDQQGLVRGKTGYLSGVVGLAGYFDKNGKEYSFVFIYNGPSKHDAQAKDLFDAIIRKW
jgi:serine-type D-Ala-D-Ala carboxypeptidase/endopeptidase (penicillin-binding protein 4)